MAESTISKTCPSDQLDHPRFLVYAAILSLSLHHLTMNQGDTNEAIRKVSPQTYSANAHKQRYFLSLPQVVVSLPLGLTAAGPPINWNWTTVSSMSP